MNPVPRWELFDTYWRFAAERQSIFFRRLDREPGPWTDDPILRSYKFCNAYRASDRVSQFLIRNVIYQSGLSPDDSLLRIILFRLFSKIETWQSLEAAHGPVCIQSFDPDTYGATLDLALDRGDPIYTNAFILAPGAPCGHKRKHHQHLALVNSVVRDGLAGKVARSRSLEEVYHLLLAFPLIGPFMAYQLAIDINYSELTDFRENDFTMPGPGALRGITKCFIDPGTLSPADIVHWMVGQQDQEFDRLGVQFQSLWSRPLHAIDCQNLFCEVDKYARVAFPGLTSSRQRIKTRFKPSPGKIEYFYPPKWRVNVSPLCAGS